MKLAETVKLLFLLSEFHNDQSHLLKLHIVGSVSI